MEATFVRSPIGCCGSRQMLPHTTGHSNTLWCRHVWKASHTTFSLTSSRSDGECQTSLTDGEQSCQPTCRTIMAIDGSNRRNESMEHLPAMFLYSPTALIRHAPSVLQETVMVRTVHNGVRIQVHKSWRIDPKGTGPPVLPLQCM